MTFETAMVCYRRFPWEGGGGGELPYKMTGMLVVALRDVNLVSLRVFGTECLYICSFSYRLALWIKKFAKNAVASVLIWSLIRGVGGGSV